MNYGCPKNCLFPWANPNALAFNTSNAALIQAFPETGEEPGTALFLSHQAALDLDWNPNSAHSFSAKYYYQHDPTTAPYAYSSLPGFPQKLDAGSQVISLSHTQILKSNLSITETFGFIREKAYSTVSQPFTMAQFTSACMNLISQAGASSVTQADCTINNFGSSIFPGMTINIPSNAVLPSYQPLLNIGAGAESMGAFTGVFQNRFNPSANAIWTVGRHTITFGGSFAYTQLNARDRRNQLGMMDAQSINQFLQGELFDDWLYSGTLFMSGDPNRYFRAKETGEYFQDKFQFRSNLAITAGIRFDWNGGFTEKNGNLLNFDPSKYSYDPTTDTIKSTGLLVAGNSPHATPGVSNSTLLGRQWGFAPRIGVAWSPKMFNNKIVVRAGWGMYYDRGELYSYLSPGVAQSITPGGPFGINQQQPFVATQYCPTQFIGTYNSCIQAGTGANPQTSNLENPFGLQPAPVPSGNPNNVSVFTATAACPTANIPGCAPPLPNANEIQNGAIPFYLGVYNRNNKLPYTMNTTLDIQWQPRNDLAIDIGYVNALGRHEIIPLPFNQAKTANPSAPLCGPNPCVKNSSGVYPTYAQFYTYGYTVQSQAPQFFNEFPLGLTPAAGQDPTAYTQMQANSEGGNVDLRVPYIGYAGESESYTAAGVSAYNALQVHVEKRLSHGLQAGFSYTFSRSFDEQSALGLFYNGSDPNQLRGGYAPSDFDRTHVFNIDYHYEFPSLLPANSWEGKVADGWAIQGLVVVQSGQPYSVIDYSGAVGSIDYSINDGITNPIVPLCSAAYVSAGQCSKVCTPQSALTGAPGNNPGLPALDPSCFTVPLLKPGDLNGGIPAGDTYETSFINGGGQRNIFHQLWQKRADVSLLKSTKLTEQFSLKYSFDVFNLTNTPSFDIPVDNVSQNYNFQGFPVQSAGNPLPSGCTPTGSGTSGTLYGCTKGLGQVVHTIGSSRQIQMSLSLAF